ncbi:MAG TPA: AMP-binding protein [Solirubrobacterales bacterium]|nr:AMP-binding protein [Candidatus Acidoferrum sp.]HYU59314.1 AMP-binding protein [Solirubrobacterales bacterium]
MRAPRAGGAASTLRDAAAAAGLAPRTLGTLRRRGVLAPTRPDRLVRALAAPLRLGTGPATLCSATAARWPSRSALIDESGALTYREIDRRGGALAAALRDEVGIEPGDGVAIMCRNHRGFVEALLAGSRLGADLLLLNTDFPAPQLAQVLESASPRVAILDQEFEQTFGEAGFAGETVAAWHEAAAPGRTIDAMVESAGSAPMPAHRRQGRVVILTSGTTGTPKRAPRTPSLLTLIGPMTTLLSEVPFHAGEPMLIAPPLFHGFGLAYLGLATLLGAPMVLRRRFDAEAALAAIDEHRVGSLIAVPVMLQRILDLPEPVRGRYDTSCLRAVISAAAPLSSDLATAFASEFGDLVYNLYGSTETGFGGVATPDDLRVAPGTVGRPPHGVTVRILDDQGAELPTGETGRVFMSGPMVFEGYADGGSKEIVDGMTSTGDLGHVDERGRLFIEGRDDDMIVSGGENVFATEVADVLARHRGVADVAVVGVPDEEFGQRLRAFVVKQEDDVSPDDLKAHVKSNLARYKVPRDIVFTAEIPRNPTGKVQRSRLEEEG